ncbi:hypothetical protein JCM14719A_14200 [Calditerricola satsumensis]|uniref:Uncharacterized protein n=1 Tax=Calditerricola satsumensis TaxID=373054 RepID=A0A8J3BBR7_9BACI|nr:hypothetical protein GCM10007043_07440 [Calditerricola satsumensis]
MLAGENETGTIPDTRKPYGVSRGSVRRNAVSSPLRSPRLSSAPAQLCSALLNSTPKRQRDRFCS